MTQCAIGLDIGVSTTKAVAIGLDGTVLATAVRDSINTQPQPRWVEREPAVFRTLIIDVLADLAERLAGHQVVGIAPTAHGDGVWVLDQDGQPVRDGVLSLDSRAREIAADFATQPLAGKLIALTGQLPMVFSATPLLRWIKQYEPDNYRRIRYILFPKDVARYWLSGDISQEYTEVSSGFTDVSSQETGPAALELQGIAEMAGAVPKVRQSTEVVGGLLTEIAEATGLPAGTPVIAGMHDIVAGSVGVGANKPGDASVIAGSYCVNQLVTDQPLVGDWLTRSFVRKGLWNLIKASPSSATNLDWCARTLLPDLVNQSQAAGQGTFGFMAHALDDLPALSETAPYYLPFLFGSPLAVDASAGLVGLRGWHTRMDIVRAVLEGIAFNHRYHMDFLPLASGAVPKVMGGICRHSFWPQALANVMQSEVEISGVSEPGALGAAMAALVGCGMFSDLEQAAAAMVRPGHLVAPNEEADLMQTRYNRYVALVETMTAWWA